VRGNNTYNWSCEVFRNLSHIKDISVLDEIDLGENGRQVYSMQASVAQREKATWQAYAASVWFRVQDKWIHAIVGENSLPG